MSTAGSQGAVLRGIACVCAIVAIVYASADILTGTAEVIHSDSSIKSILASMALDQGRLLPIGWTFANGDLLTMTPYLFSLPLTWLFGMGLASNAWATWLGEDSTTPEHVKAVLKVMEGVNWQSALEPKKPRARTPRSDGAVSPGG